MFNRLSKSVSPGKVPGAVGPETAESAPIDQKTLSGRWAGIIGASFAIAVIAGILTYLATGKSGASMYGGILAGGAAFTSAVSFLNSHIA
jgi:hypothetical protein